ncbi:MAG: helix-turn-helix domain-containing protein [Candidatus Andersenbacteria bacterium]
MKTVFTVGQAAKICGVVPSTMNKWFNSGRIKGYRIPGSQHRRIPREYLISFLKEYGIPLGDLENEDRVMVLLVGVDAAMIEAMTTTLKSQYFTIDYATDGFSAGIKVEALHPHCLVVDYAMVHTQASLIVQRVRRNPRYADVPVVGLFNDRAAATEVERASCTEIFRRPFDTALLTERVRTLASQQKEKNA